MKIIRSILLLLFLLATLLTIALILARAYPTQILDRLSPEPMNVTQLAIHSIGVNRSVIDSLQFTLHNPDSNALPYNIIVAANDIQVNYNWRLLKARRLESLTIGSLHLKLTTSTSPVSQNTDESWSLQSHELLSSKLLGVLPIDALQLPDIQLDLSIDDKQGLWLGSVIKEGPQLQLAIVGNSAQKLELQLSIQESDRLQATLIKQSSNIIDLDFSATEQPNSKNIAVDMSAHLALPELKPLLNLLNNTGTINEDLQLGGSLQASLSGILPEQIDLAALLALSTTIKLQGNISAEYANHNTDSYALSCGSSENPFQLSTKTAHTNKAKQNDNRKPDSHSLPKILVTVSQLDCRATTGRFPLDIELTENSPKAYRPFVRFAVEAGTELSVEQADAELNPSPIHTGPERSKELAKEQSKTPSQTQDKQFVTQTNIQSHLLDRLKLLKGGVKAKFSLINADEASQKQDEQPLIEWLSVASRAPSASDKVTRGTLLLSASKTLGTRIGFNATLHSPYFHASNLVLKNTDVSLVGELSLRESALQLSIRPGVIATSKSLTVRPSNANASRQTKQKTEKLAANIKSANVKLDNELSIVLNRSDTSFNLSSLSASPLKLSIKSLPFNVDGYSLPYRNLSISTKAFSYTDAEKTVVNGKLKLSGLQTLVGDIRLQTLKLNSSFKLSKNLVEGQATVESSDSSALKLITKFRHNTANESGSAALSILPIAFNPANSIIPDLFKDWPFPVDFTGGTITFNGDSSWQKNDMNVSALVKFNNIAGFYQRNTFNDLNTQLKIAYGKQALRLLGNTLTVANLDIGIPIKKLSVDLSADLSGPIKSVYVSNFSANLLGGHIETSDFVISQPLADASINVNVSGIELTQLMDLESGMHGTGTLDGLLPIVVSDAGISMNAGLLRARPPGGIIQYKANSSVDYLNSMPQLKLALDALQNFRYEVLDIEAHYEQNGRLSLKTKLQGKNPEMDSKRPIHFNLNITEDIPALLESLQLTQNISEQLDKRILERYQSR